MPIASTLSYVKGLLASLPMPGELPPMNAYITPPDPNVEADIPTAYVWPSEGDENRDSGKAGTVPRNTGPGTASGFKNIEHAIDVYVVWFGADDQPDIDSLFPGIVDAVMFALRTSADPATAVDPYTEQETTLIDVGETMRYRITLRSLVEQAFDRYDCLLSLSVLEVIQA